jgi:orotidine-5'-phosphate decarboxylase
MGYEQIIFPLDVPDIKEASKLSTELRGLVGVMKVGLELFTAAGPQAVIACQMCEYDVFLDLKLHDIPETVDRAVARAVDLGAKFVTMHVQQPAAIERALKRTQGTTTTVLIVTVLTSMLESDLEWLGYKITIPAARAESVAYRCYQMGARGFVCSPHEVSMIRKTCPEAKLVVPGIRPADSVASDQKRVGTPKQAIKDGADYIVVGRPIRDASDRKIAAQAIAQEVDDGLAAR